MTKKKVYLCKTTTFDDIRKWIKYPDRYEVIVPSNEDGINAFKTLRGTELLVYHFNAIICILWGENPKKKIDWLGMTEDGDIKYNIENARLTSGNNPAINLFKEKFYQNKPEVFIKKIKDLEGRIYDKFKDWIRDGEVTKEFENSLEKIINILERGSKMKEQAAEIPINLIKEMVVKGNHYQIILTGAPGTGKTHDAREFAEKHGATLGQNTDGTQKLYEFVQFHSSYDYSDFVEGLRPVDDGNGGMKFVKMDGIFKNFCRKVVELNSKEIISEGDKTTNGIPDDSINGKKYFFIIDEINRADLGKVFGELMFGLEESYRGKKHAFTTQYQNLPTYTIENGTAKLIQSSDDCFAEGFFIPKNIVIIGTMNDIDRSVEAFDFALRRRFQWIEVKANDVMEYKLEDMRSKNDNAWKAMAKAAIKMNKMISEQGKEYGLGEAYHLGPAYFQSGDKEHIWKYKVEPILREYCRGFDGEALIESCFNAFMSPATPQEQQSQGESI